MKIYCKWAFALMPVLLAGCKDEIDQPQGPIANSGDDVQFMIAADVQSRTVYAELWAETGVNDIFWGNYVTGEKEYVNIYCPTNPERGFARYEITPRTEGDLSSAGSISKTTTVGVQWGESGKPYTFYAFYPADKASTNLENGTTVRATVETGQNARSYKMRENTSSDAPAELANLNTYFSQEWSKYNSTAQYVDAPAKTLFGMPDMRAAVMVANTTMPADQFGLDVPLDFKVLADVIDITLNGPVTPNTLGGNGNTENPDGIQREYIRIQSVTLEVVNITGNDIEGNPITDKTPIKDLPIDNSLPISGSFDLNMDKVPAITAAVAAGADATAAVKEAVTSVSGPASVQLQLGTYDGSAVSFPTMFTRPGGDVIAGQNVDTDELDHLRLRAFLIPGQINSTNMNKLRVHIQTDCGDYYQMLQNDTKFVTGQIYPVKLGYFRQEGAEFDYSRWIGLLDPNIYITELSIPGAWHAANSNYQGGVSLADMYKAGVRAFEVHTQNGNELRDPNNFENAFNLATSTENFPDYFPGGTNMTEERYATDIQNISNNGSSWERTDITIDGTQYTRRRAVTATATVTWLVPDDPSYQLLVPKFALRLFRTNNTSEPLSTAIINLASNLRSDGLMFIEIGEEGATPVSGVPYRAKVFKGKKYVQTNITINGYEGGSTSTSWGIIVTPSGKYSWNLDGIDFTNVTPQTGQITDDRSGTFNLTAREAWSIAVRSCLERMQREINPSTNKYVLYSGPLTRFTTIRDVQGQVIAKVNTNGSDDKGDSEADYLWGSDCPALFSRWIDGSGTTPLTINLAWKQAVVPYDGGNSGTPNTPLRWCFTELDNIGSSVTTRETALKEMNTIAAANYANQLHRTFYESSLGGFLNGTVSVDNCQAVAKSLNPFALELITNPSRQAVPLGLVFMNYVIPPTGQDDIYKSTDLIRAIINNNRAFLLRRAGDSDSDVEDQTNSNYWNNPTNPLKP